MTAPNALPNAPRAAADAPPAWHDDAERLGPALDRAHAVLVVGRDGDAAAWVALGAARAQAARRRVAVADLVGDAPALAALADPDDPIGISDSFFYGVSLNKIARPADAAGNLFVLPSGSEPVAVEEVVTSDRWRRLAAGFREAGALLLLAARADTPGLDRLATLVDGLVVVGDLGGLLPDAPAPLMVIPGPSTRRGRATPRAAEPAAERTSGTRPTPPGGAPTDAAVWAAWQQAAAAAPGGTDAPAGPAAAAPTDARLTPRQIPRVESQAGGAAPPPTRRYLLPVALAAVVLAAAAASWAYVARAPRDAPSPAAAAVRRPAPAAPAAPRESVPAAPAASPAAAPAGELAPANPADSANAAAYTVFLVGANTPEGATLEGVDQAALPLLSLTPVLDDGGATWWRLFAGAYPTRQRADALLADLRRRGVLGASSGVVLRAPYALLVADRLPASQAPARVRALSGRGVPTYPMSRGDGTVALYAGAFERPAEAEYLATALRAAGVTPVLVYRTGGSL